MAEVKRPWSAPQIFFSALFGIALWSAVGFSWFGFGFNWTTQKNANVMASNAVVEQLALICAAQARSSPDAPAELEKLAKVETWNRREFVEKAKWAIMPGSKTEESGVARLCADKLLET